MSFNSVPPAWIYTALEYKSASLVANFSLLQLKNICQMLKLCVHNCHTKHSWALEIVNAFHSRCNCLIAMSSSKLVELLYNNHVAIHENQISDFYILLALELQEEFTSNVFASLCKPDRSIHTSTVLNPSENSYPWTQSNHLQQVANLNYLPLNHLNSCLHKNGHVFQKSCQSASLQIVTLFNIQCKELNNYSDNNVVAEIRCLQPFLPLPSYMSREFLLHHLLSLEFSPEVLIELCHTTPHQFSKSTEHRHVSRQKNKDLLQLQANENDALRKANWPSKVPEDVIKECLHNYYMASQWKNPLTCASCDRKRYNVHIHTDVVTDELGSQLHFDLLKISDLNVKAYCNNPSNPDPFYFNHPVLNGLMLSSFGIYNINDPYDTKISFCKECRLYLSKGQLPKFSLKNKLYCGSLPPEFQDLTWVEEMVCSKYLLKPRSNRG